jgi:multimeric flavodoxin WrbA
MRRILGIAGSPRRGGNTDILLDSYLGGAGAAGYKVDKVIVSELNISPCRECNSCYETGECVIRDDMDRIYKSLLEVDRIVIATPVFFMGPTAQLKSVIDRCQALWARRFILKMPLCVAVEDRRGFLLSVGGLSKGKSNFQCAINIIRSLFFVLDVKYMGELTFYGINEKAEIKQHQGILEEAYNAGKNI